MLDRMVSVLSFRFRFRFDLSLFLCPSYQLAPPDVVNTVYMYVMIDCIITIFRVIYRAPFMGASSRLNCIRPRAVEMR